jgi:Pyruvate/2-oxoacid:ferredoxin oxidoreductase delta subunit
VGKPKAKVDKEECLACGGCIAVCPKDAISMYANSASISYDKCNSCTICISICPIGAIKGEVL